MGDIKEFENGCDVPENQSQNRSPCNSQHFTNTTEHDKLHTAKDNSNGYLLSESKSPNHATKCVDNGTDEHNRGDISKGCVIASDPSNVSKTDPNQTQHVEELCISLPNLNYYFEDPESQRKRENEIEGDQKNEPLRTWLLLVNIWIFYLIYGFHYMAFGIYYVKWTSAFDTSKAASGFVGAIHQFVNSICGIFAPVILEKIGPKWTGMFGTSVIVCGVLGSAFAPSLGVLFFTYGFLAGFGAAITGVPAAVLIQTHFTKHRAMATSISVVGLPTGNLIAPILVRYFIERFGWRGALMMHAGILLQTFVLIQMWPSQNKQSSIDETTQSSSLCQRIFDVSLLKEFLPMLYIIACLIYRFALITIIEHSPSRAVHIGCTLQEAAFLMTVFGAGSVITRSLSSLILPLDCVNPLVTYSVVMLTQSVCACLVTIATTYYQVVAIMFLTGLAQGFMVPSAILSMVKLTSIGRFARMMVFSNFLGGITALLATPVSGRIFDVTQNYDIPFYVAAGFALTGSIGLLAVFILHKLKEKRELDLNAKIVASSVGEGRKAFQQELLERRHLRERKFTI